MFDFIEDADLRQKAIDAYEAGVEGLKKKNGELIGSEKTLKQSLAVATEKLGEFDGLDPKETKKVLADMKEERLKTMLGDNKVEEVINERIAEVEKRFTLKLDAANKTAKEATERLNETQLNNSRLKFGNQVSEEAAKSGVRKDALAAITREVNEIFKPDGDSFVALNTDGEAIPSPQDPSKGLSIGDYIESLRETSPFYFDKQKGGGMKRGDGPTNPDFAKLPESEQRKIIDANPDMAKSLPVIP